MTSWITICDTCKRDDWVPETAPDGARLADLIEPLAGGAVRTRRHSCLMGCTHGCNITVQAQGKICYTLGRFEPTAEAAAAIVAWAGLHADSATGQVPYRTWPEPVKGHFVTRHLPLPEPE